MNEAYIEIRKFIRDCRDCPHMAVDSQWLAICTSMNMKIDRPYTVPDWCPYLIEDGYDG